MSIADDAQHIADQRRQHHRDAVILRYKIALLMDNDDDIKVALLEGEYDEWIKARITEVHRRFREIDEE